MSSSNGLQLQSILNSNNSPDRFSSASAASGAPGSARYSHQDLALAPLKRSPTNINDPQTSVDAKIGLFIEYKRSSNDSLFPSAYEDLPKITARSKLQRVTRNFDSISTCMNPPNPLFTVALFGLHSLLDFLDLSQHSLWTQRNIKGKPPLVVALESLPTASSGLNKFFDLLRHCPASAINSTTSSGKSLLHIACERNAFQVASRIVEYNVDLNARDETGTTVIFAAIQHCNVDLVQLLQRHGARLDTQNAAEATHLWLEISRRFMDSNREDCEKMVKMLKCLAETNLEFLRDYTVSGYNLIHVAANYNSVTLLKFLLTTGVNVDG